MSPRSLCRGVFVDPVRAEACRPQTERRHRFAHFRWVLIVMTLAVAFPAQARDETVSASLDTRFAEFVDEITVWVSITVTCQTGASILESFLYKVQRASTSQFAFFNPTCDGTPHTHVVTVRPEEGITFRRGPAPTLGYVLLTSGEAVSPTRKIVVR